MIALSAALVVVIVAAVVTILLINQKDSTTVGGGGTPAPSAAPYPGGALPSGPSSPNTEPNTAPNTEPNAPGTDTTDTDAPDTETPGTDTTDTDQPSAGGNDEEAAAAADQAFWEAIKAADYDKAESLTCSEYRSSLAADAKKFFNGREGELGIKIGKATITGDDTAQVEQTITFPGEDTDTNSMDMKKEDGAWLVCTS